VEKPILLLILESPTHPNFVEMYQQQGFDVKIVNSMRKAMATLKNTQPAYIMCEFFYGFGNNYAGINLSNLDVMLHALRRYSPNSKVVTFYQKEEYPFLLKLKSLFEIHAEFCYPVKQADVKQILAERC
jgi:hypothetical protein